LIKKFDIGKSEKKIRANKIEKFFSIFNSMKIKKKIFKNINIDKIQLLKNYINQKF
jgi:hypothetical protein